MPKFKSKPFPIIKDVPYFFSYHLFSKFYQFFTTHKYRRTINIFPIIYSFLGNQTMDVKIT